MTTAPDRRVRRRAAPLVLAVAAIGALGTTLCPVPEARALPSPDADPATVVRSYVAAINAQDGRAVRALSATPGAAESVNAWFGSRIILRQVHDPVPEDGAGTEFAGRTVVDVPTTIALHHGDESMRGIDSWTFLLVRDEQSGRWLVFGQGQG